MTRKQEIEAARKKAAKKYTELQLKYRKFCTDCLTFKIKKGFSYNSSSPDGRQNVCKKCMSKREKARDYKNKLLAQEIYAPGANQIVVDKMIGGRGLVSKQSLATFLGVHERTVIRMKNKGELQAYDFLGQTYFKKEDVERWLEEKLGEKIELDSKFIS